jgi:hypothetical protein
MIQKNWKIIAIAVALTLGTSIVSAHHAWVYLGYELHWPRYHKGPINLELVDQTSISDYNWTSHTREAAKDWSKSRSLNVNWNVNRRGNAEWAQCSLTSQCIEVWADDYGQNGWLGIGGGNVTYDPATDQLHWTAGIAVMNDFYYDTEPYASFYGNYQWRQTVMCQEIGHALGLTHIDEDFSTNIASCMDYAADPYPHPFEHDYEVLDQIHDHVEEFVPPAGPPIIPPGLAQGEWGELISSNGFSSLYVRDLGDNQYWITHVTWAQEQ